MPIVASLNTLIQDLARSAASHLVHQICLLICLVAELTRKHRNVFTLLFLFRFAHLIVLYFFESWAAMLSIANGKNVRIYMSQSAIHVISPLSLAIEEAA